MKKKCTLSIAQELWDLAKTNNANVSKLLETSIEMKYGHLADILNKGFGYCFIKNCGKKIEMEDLKLSLIKLVGKEITEAHPDQTLTKEEREDLHKRTMFFFYAMCPKCLDKMVQRGKGIEKTILKPADLFKLLEDMKKINNINEYLTVPAKGQIWINDAYEFVAITNGISVSQAHEEALEPEIE